MLIDFSSLLAVYYFSGKKKKKKAVLSFITACSRLNTKSQWARNLFFHVQKSSSACLNLCPAFCNKGVAFPNLE